MELHFLCAALALPYLSFFLSKFNSNLKNIHKINKYKNECTSSISTLNSPSKFCCLNFLKSGASGSTSSLAVS